MNRPAVLVWSSLFPSSAQPLAGIFIRERMFRVARSLPLTVIAPQPWFPFQWIIRMWRPHFRPMAPTRERQGTVDVYRPRYLCIPGILKRLDGWLMWLCCRGTARRLWRSGQVDIIDAHFAYPDGYAAVRVARALGVPSTVTLRGTEVRQSQDPALRTRLQSALTLATRIFAVSDSLGSLATRVLGVRADKIRTIGNGVDTDVFRPGSRSPARAALGIPNDATVLITVGGLVSRKGFHRVIDCLSRLRGDFPDLYYLIVGSAGPEGDYQAQLQEQVGRLDLADRVRFVGARPPDGVAEALAAADLFVLASSNEGWANVLLESLACGVPVVATDVGGNAQVICRPELGTVVPLDDGAALCTAIACHLRTPCDRGMLRRYAEENSWQSRVEALLEEFNRLGVRHESAR